MNVVKCNNATSDVTCKSPDEINDYIDDNLYLYRFVDQPMIDINYMGMHMSDYLPFFIGQLP